MLDDTFKCTLMGKYDGQAIQNVLWYQDTSVEPTSCPHADLALLLDGIWKGPMTTATVSTYTYDGWTIQLYDPLPDDPTYHTPSGTGTGTRPGFGLPGTVASVITKKTGFSGRRFRGRFYGCGVSEDDSALGLLTLGGQLTWAGVANAMIQTGFAGPFNFIPVVRSFRPLSVVPLIRTKIVTYVVRGTMGNQRRRRPGVGI